MKLVKNKKLITLAIARLIHVIYGIITGLAPPHLAIIMAIVFLFYELDEEYHIKDTAYRDIRDYAIGLTLASLRYIIA